MADGQSESARARGLWAGQQDFSCPVEREEEAVALDPDLPGLMPDLKGLGVRDVLRKTRQLGLKVVIKGSGRAVEQSPAPGAPLKEERLLTVTLRPPG